MDLDLGRDLSVHRIMPLPTGPWGALLSSILGLTPFTGKGGGGISCLLQNRQRNGVSLLCLDALAHFIKMYTNITKLCVPVPLTRQARGTLRWGSCSLGAAHWEACT